MYSMIFFRLIQSSITNHYKDLYEIFFYRFTMCKIVCKITLCKTVLNITFCVLLNYLRKYTNANKAKILPIGGVANVCRPTIWAGPRPSRKSLNWLSGPSLVVGKMNLKYTSNIAI